LTHDIIRHLCERVCPVRTNAGSGVDYLPITALAKLRTFAAAGRIA
jgi:hypothetical protein